MAERIRLRILKRGRMGCRKSKFGRAANCVSAAAWAAHSTQEINVDVVANRCELGVEAANSDGGFIGSGFKVVEKPCHKGSVGAGGEIIVLLALASGRPRLRG